MVDYQVEIVVLPVSDVDRAKEFYGRLGFREDVDYAGPAGFRVVHFTPPGSSASIIVGSGVTDAAPGSSKGVHLVVDDIVAAHDDLVAKGVDVSEVFHDAGGVFHHAGTDARVAGPHPDRQTYGSFLSFTDPDGNQFFLQEVTKRLPGRVSQVVYGSVGEVEQALRDAAIAHGKHEAEVLGGKHDEDWPAWYAAYMAEAAGLAA
ncbi:catechol 2,3-dioxygenase-like lactoylglutathione lyase family enzyme [Actinoplanes lutulentus]|uniref:Catechol 2,3-dioxygenase-like lactoylglutathione lyase family enzyme n=1 Tax=Actinoplanes lutulentus TaxID=1287878 RepID=A0A327ZQG8_9ACTN|nr:VOC family protein [Actinoplanes lutulentus]MBB2940839.1 catechol 2,3-dioxygenase-like lactoylglutathione lyase family enzyme [Actinoplanes lutulentus]RAK43148.1 catechol 2,3-dioxygenase-like lactoylglutathione lyase family enzyme [Actinoplanes lutulentus]